MGGAALGLAAAGCVYVPGELLEHREVLVRIFDNVDERRTHEFDLTRSVMRELAARGVHVNTAEAPVELRGTIRLITAPSVVEGAGDVVVVGAVSFQLDVELVQRGTKKVLSRAQRTESASFSTARGESRETARQEVFDRLARWVVTRLEKDW
ncbi:MAG: hypothetical protein HY716_15280 [Planctomycetes bacterium]|nr:hypothetical protein [Planctomycetota bacterium]